MSTHKSSGLLSQIETGYAEWSELVESVSAQLLTVPGAAGEWSVKDMISHIAWSEWWLAEFITTRNWPNIPDHLNLMDTDERNHAYFLDQKDRPLDEVLEVAASSHRALLDAVSGLGEAEFEDQTLLGMPADDGWELGRLIPASTTTHYREHMSMIESWLSTLQTDHRGT